MIRYPLRLIPGLMLTACLVLALACSPAPRTTPPEAPASDQSRQLRQRVEELNQRAARLDAQLDELREAQTRQLAEVTSESQALADELGRLALQLGGKPAPATHSTETPAARAKGPLGPLVRLFLIIIMLFALWIMARIFLGRLGEEDEEDDDSAADAADEDLAAEDGKPGLSRDAQPEEPKKNMGGDESAKP